MCCSVQFHCDAHAGAFPSTLPPLSVCQETAIHTYPCDPGVIKVYQADEKEMIACRVLSKAWKHHLLTNAWARWGAAAVERRLTSHSSKTNNKCVSTTQALCILLYMVTGGLQVWLGYRPPVPLLPKMMCPFHTAETIWFWLEIVILNIYELTVNEHLLSVRHYINASRIFSKLILTVTPSVGCSYPILYLRKFRLNFHLSQTYSLWLVNLCLCDPTGHMHNCFTMLHDSILSPPDSTYFQIFYHSVAIPIDCVLPSQIFS